MKQLTQKQNKASYKKKIDKLKGLSHEIDFKNFDKNLQNMA